MSCWLLSENDNCIEAMKINLEYPVKH
jgi:hypothetical protein